MAKCNWYMLEDRQHMCNHHPYGCTDKGTAYRPDGSPINFAGDEEVYLRKLAEKGLERHGYVPDGTDDSRTEKEATITIQKYRELRKAGKL